MTRTRTTNLLRTGAALMAALVFLHGYLLFRSCREHRMAVEYEAQGEHFMAARAHASAIGFYAPLNPFSRASALDLLRMERSLGKVNPDLAFDIGDRRKRAIRGIRSFYQPYSDLLDSSSAPHQGNDDPGILFSLMALVWATAGLAIPWIRRWTCPQRAALSVTAWVLWALSLLLA